MGDLRIIKQGDVMVITNGFNYIDRPNTSFSTQFKQQMKYNFAFGNLNMKDLMAQLAIKEQSNKEKDKMNKVSEQFEALQFKSSKKIENNKLQIEMSLHSSAADKNIILQTLDLISILNN